MSEPVKICIVMDGGSIQAISTMGVPVSVLVIDYDTEGADPEDLATIPQPSNHPFFAQGQQQAVISIWAAETQGPEEVALCERLFADFAA